MIPARTHVGFLVLAALLLACSSSQSSGAGGSCFQVGDRFCPKDAPVTQAEVSACNACSAKYRALMTCDPKAGFVCIDGKSDTRKDGVCGAQINVFESCFIDALRPRDASAHD
jgi:hypothetical protein